MLKNKSRSKNGFWMVIALRREVGVGIGMNTQEASGEQMTFSS